jgi:hypothetical protein
MQRSEGWGRMDAYEARAWREVHQWKHELRRPSGGLKQLSKRLQTKMNHLIPSKIHEVMTETIKTMVQTVLWGSEYTTKKTSVAHLSLESREVPIFSKIKTYKKTAAIEGAGTGAGGIFLGLADFPLLLSIKMKLLFEIAAMYGMATDRYEERIYLLQVFQLAFSSDERRLQVLEIIENWDERKQALQELDWRVFQQEYRDYIDFSKMLQMLPIIGAPVGAYANYNLVDHLGKTAMNCYRMRVIEP